MYTQNSINPLRSVSLPNNGAEFSQYKETFHDIFRHALNSKSNSRPPKIELTGILAPRGHTNLLPLCKFRLETDSREYLLSMSETLATVAKKMEWEEVTVKGYLDFDAEVFEVEKISLSRNHEPFEAMRIQQDRCFDLESYARTIAQVGKLDLADNELVS